MAKALDVATYLIQLAAGEDEPDQLSPMRVQKLLYYVQGWSLALRGKPFFDGRIEAWVYGPVAPNVYKAFAKYGNNPIHPDDFLAHQTALTKDERTFIEEVWEAYKGYSAISLKDMTHKEEPWLAARGTLSPTARCTTEITHQAMKKFFKSTAK